MSQSPEHSPVGEAMVWASRIMAIGLTMFLPGVAGNWLDARLGTQLLGPAGLVIGFSTGIFWLAQLGRQSQRRRRERLAAGTTRETVQTAGLAASHCGEQDRTWRPTGLHGTVRSPTDPRSPPDRSGP